MVFSRVVGGVSARDAELYKKTGNRGNTCESKQLAKLEDREREMFLRVLNVQRRGGLNRFGGVRNLFIQTSSTPNPNGLKFQPAGKEVLPEEYGSSMVRSFETRKRFQT